jgi:hypothetical protein
VLKKTAPPAWPGDLNGDGWLDLAVGNYWAANRVYLNLGGALETVPSWQSADAMPTTSLAWGDYDGDRDLDLAAGERGEPDRIYLSQGGVLSASPDWTSDRIDLTNAIALGDLDGDGDLDLTTGGGATYLYPNPGRPPLIDAVSVFSTTLADASALAFGDYDNDGDLDLAVAAEGPNALYHNQGLDGAGQVIFEEVVGALGVYTETTTSLAWGDFDADGD